ncbi:sugar phosphate isomerase/epimerase and 4-hydroxyphenylpyruvate domain-containing protein [Salinibacterium sp. SYSU T00001]|uniref:bifunctional sugar phosphate isomerase/epimerase/4-hydroxyphenylpyruvate dioxygenase family protein n=1 Tax=Homoserinimonas sedimenticola TaxID=2986805 RepID=UPI00223677DC|nr:sugar phosphate isomerase/epimerase and 4-hydroxyphenylpyruvate domain-containing protein [Salinibacterium sedimenticola]MCW4385480.1 sugar phosphate isomerase/epimerase and 4-hydroxyphenylpyruvate domain-containing protein [Salinibacterium sedimenticola]
MKTSIATVCLSGSLEDKLHACALAGFDAVEIFEQDLIVSPHSPERIRDLAARLGISLSLYQPLRDLEGVEPDLFARNLRYAEGKFGLMRRLGITTVLVCSNVATATIDDDTVIAGQLRELGLLAERYDVRIAYEALAWGRYVNDFEHAQRIVDEVDLPNVGQCLDSFHILSRDWAVEPLASLPAEKIFFVQLADAPIMELDVLSWSRHYRVFPGEGGFDLVSFFGHLLAAGYDGPVSLEIFNDTFRQAEPFRTAVDGMRSLVWLQDAASRWLEEHPGGSPRMKLQALPPIEPVTGFNFVEVRADDSHQARDVLAKLGFENRGRHRTKEHVELWRQGHARIIVNEQPTSDREPAVAGLGFDVEHPLRAASRALRLRAEEVPRRQALDEEVLRAVRAPDFTEVFFSRVDESGAPPWSVEFGDEEADAGALLTAIDHVNLAQPWQHFHEAVLFYESVLGLTPRQGLEVAAPLGLIRSQPLENDPAAVRLALNVIPAGHEGEAENLVYPQHVAFSCSDIVAFAAECEARGLEFLPIPENYYDDLGLRFDLDAEFVRELREHHLLFDRDESGEFLHFYTAAVGKVFFEIVQRRGSYDGYGAPNAAVRLSAQHRVRRGHTHGGGAA